MDRRNRTRPWLVYFAMACAQGGAFGLIYNCIGVLFAAIRTDMGFSASGLGFYFLIYILMGAVCTPIITKRVINGRTRLVMGSMLALYSLTIAAMAVQTSLWHWYVNAAFAGFGTCGLTVVIAVVIGNWFEKNRGLLLGICMASSGIISAVFSPICSSLIENFGWRATAVVMGITGIVISAVPVWLFGDTSPEKAGCRPYGAGDVQVVAEGNAEQEPPEATDIKIPGWVFAAICVAMILPVSILNMTSQLAIFAQSLGHSLTVGAVLTSCCMAGNVGGKIISGFLSDRIGIYKTIYLVLAVNVAGMLLFLAEGLGVYALYAGAVCMGTMYSLSVTLPPHLFRAVYGSRDYSAKYTVRTAIGGYISAFLSWAFPFVYDFTGSFKPVFVFGAVSCAAAIAAFMAVRHRCPVRSD